jgi:hypothetical protein
MTSGKGNTMCKTFQRPAVGFRLMAITGFGELAGLANLSEPPH